MRLIHVSAFLLLAACSGSAATPAPTSPVVATSAPISAPTAAPATSSTSYIATLDPPPPAGPFDALPKSLTTTLSREPKPAPVKRSGKAWPFHAWDRAEAVVMNWSAYGPDSEMHAYDEKGWTQRLAYRAPLDAELAQRSVAIAVKQGGEIITTKCPIPRHAVVLFEGNTPVASINVDFTCENVLLWPPAPASREQVMMAPKLAKEFVPQWRNVFEGQLHFPMWNENEDTKRP